MEGAPLASPLRLSFSVPVPPTSDLGHHQLLVDNRNRLGLRFLEPHDSVREVCLLPSDIQLSDQRTISVQLEEVSCLITRKLETMVETTSWFATRFMKATSALLPFAAREERDGRYLTLDTLLHIARTRDWSVWHRIVPALINETSPLAIVLISPYVDWGDARLADHRRLFTQWAAATSEIPYTEEVGWSVVDVLLQVSEWSFLLSRIPVGMWGWFEKLPPLPPKSHGRALGRCDSAIRHVRGLGDIKILKSYLLLIWSEWDTPWPDNFPNTCALIMEEFGGAEMKRHREDLIKHLDRVLGQFDQGPGYLQQQKPYLYPRFFQQAKEEYRKIREVLVEVNKGVVRTQTRTPPRTITLFNGLLTPLLNSGSSTRLYGMRLTAALCNGAVRGQPVDSHMIICHTSVTCERHSHVCIYTI